MNPASLLVQKKIEKLRRRGSSHRDIAKALNVSLGTAFKYSREVKLSTEQEHKLRVRGAIKLNARLTKEEKQRNGRKGGLVTPRTTKIPRSRLLEEIESFHRETGRVPLKRETHHYIAYRRVFGTWNNAIKAAGLAPNPVRFAHKFIANDGHKCDSLSEKIIDDWLNARKIEHRINVPYPGNNRFTADFVVGNHWIEFFGLSGEHERYDELKEQKVGVAKDHALALIEIYPQDLFPEFKLEKRLAILLTGM